MRLLLDTHVLLRWFDVGGSLSTGHRRSIESARGSEPLWVSDISLWEVAMLQDLGRIPGAGLASHARATLF